MNHIHNVFCVQKLLAAYLDTPQNYMFWDMYKQQLQITYQYYNYLYWK